MAKIERAKSPEKNSDLPQDLAIAALVLLNLGFVLLDFYTHSNQGLADLEKRRMLEVVIGDLAKYIGNYGFSSSLATAAVFAKYGFDSIIRVKKEVSLKFLMRVIAAITLLNITIESFSSINGNNQFMGDSGLGFAGAVGGAISLDLLIRRIKAKRNANLL